MTSRLHQHSTLPPAVISATHGSTHLDVHSKSHVLAGVQDAYWSDDEAEDAECPLCLEEMDISDMNFKPCQCGYQICRFCWHHIKENLNGRCPACRREYTDEAVQFKPVEKADHKRLTQQKKQRERERKELDTLGRRHLANLRVVQRNVVYVVGIGPRFAKEELIPTLRSSEFFGQYGKISKTVLVKKTPPGGRAPVVGLYITYHRREDAARAIAAVDGTPSPGGGNDTMRASYGTSKYCMAFLRGANCTTQGCMDLHEWGDERDCFTKEDLTTLKHTMKDSETRTTIIRKDGEADGLPRSAAWGSKGPSTTTFSYATPLSSRTNGSTSMAISARGTRGGRRGKAGSSGVTTSETRATSTVKAASKNTKSPSHSRAATPANAGLPPRPNTPTSSTTKTQRHKDKEKVAKPVPAPSPSRSPPSSPTPDSDSGSWQDVGSSPSMRPQSVLSMQSVDSGQLAAPSAPPGIPAAPPGIPVSPAITPAVPAAPPGIGLPQPMSAIQPPPPPSQYKMSTTARALLDDLMSVRQDQISTISPFPDFDRTLQCLRDDDDAFGGFSFNLDPKVAEKDLDADLTLPDLPATTSLNGGFMDTFPAFKQGSQPVSIGPPGLSYTQPTSRFFNTPVIRQEERPSSTGSSYTGSFNPFSEPPEQSRTHTPASPLLEDEPQRVSRFGFARARRGSSAISAASSPLVSSNPLSNPPINGLSQYSHGSDSMVRASQWSQASTIDFSGRPIANTFAQSNHSASNSPFVHHAQPQGPQDLYQHAQPQQQQQQSRFQPFDESMLKEMIGIGRDRPSASRMPEQTHYSGQHFNDPAIMSMQRSSSMHASENDFPSNHQQFGPPPGLAFPPGLMPHLGATNSTVSSTAPLANTEYSHQPSANSAQVSVESTPISISPVLSSVDFPALTADQPHRSASLEQEVSAGSSSTLPESESLQAAADEKARKQAEAKAKAEQRREEKAAAKAARTAALKEKKDREAKEKAEKEKVEKEAKLAKEQAEKERTDKERAEKAEREKIAKLKEAEEKAEKDRKARERAEKERTLQAERAEKAAAKKAAAEKIKAAAPVAAAPAKVTAGKASSEPSPVDRDGQAPLLSKLPKKHKPTKRTGKEIDLRDPSPEATTHQAIGGVPPSSNVPSSSSNTSVTEVVHSKIKFEDTQQDPAALPATIPQLLEDLENAMYIDFSRHPFFDVGRICPNTKLPLDYVPLVHALSALSVGGGSFATAAAAAANGVATSSGSQMPGGIDNAVSSFQQLLETLTQTISDLLRLLPRATWDDSTSFDGVLRDMLKGDDFLDDGGLPVTDLNAPPPMNAAEREDEVAALTLALERRARWMEVQLAKLEELHRDINMAAVRAVLAFSDRGWDVRGFLPRHGGSLARFDEQFTSSIANPSTAPAADGSRAKSMSTNKKAMEELENRLRAAREKEALVEAEMHQSMMAMQALLPPV